MSIKKNLIEIFKSSKFTLKEAYDANPDIPEESVRARIYEKILERRSGRLIGEFT